MITGTTKSGFKYELGEDVADNWELFEMLAGLEENPMLLPKVLDAFLGVPQKKALIEHLRDKETGIVKTSAMEAELIEIMSAHKKLKNS